MSSENRVRKTRLAAENDLFDFSMGDIAKALELPVPDRQLLTAFDAADGGRIAHRCKIQLCRFAVNFLLRRPDPGTLQFPVEEIRFLQALCGSSLQGRFWQLASIVLEARPVTGSSAVLPADDSLLMAFDRELQLLARLGSGALSELADPGDLAILVASLSDLEVPVAGFAELRKLFVRAPLAPADPRAITNPVRAVERRAEYCRRATELVTKIEYSLLHWTSLAKDAAKLRSLESACRELAAPASVLELDMAVCLVESLGDLFRRAAAKLSTGPGIHSLISDLVAMLPDFCHALLSGRDLPEMTILLLERTSFFAQADRSCKPNSKHPRSDAEVYSRLPSAQRSRYLLKCRNIFTDAAQLIATGKGTQGQDQQGLLRLLHTQKGGAYMAQFPRLAEQIHEFETCLEDRDTNSEISKENFLALIEEQCGQLVKKIEQCVASLPAAPSPGLSSGVREMPLPGIELDLVAGAQANPLRKGENFWPISFVPPSQSAECIDLLEEAAATDSQIASMVSVLETRIAELLSAMRAPALAAVLTDGNQNSACDRMLVLTKDLSARVHSLQNLLDQNTKIHEDFHTSLSQPHIWPALRLRRLTRCFGRMLKKNMSLVIELEDPQRNAILLESMLTPVAHVLQNAVVHGIETTADRKAAGKSMQGRIELRVSKQDTNSVIEIVDDGAGMNPALIEERARKLGLDEQGESGADPLRLTLHPGLSTVAEATPAAGRGFGLHVLQDRLRNLGGMVRIQSSAGKGTKFVISVPEEQEFLIERAMPARK